MRAVGALAVLGNDLMLDCSSDMLNSNKVGVDWHDVKFGDDGDKLNNFFLHAYNHPDIKKRWGLTFNRPIITKKAEDITRASFDVYAGKP